MSPALAWGKLKELHRLELEASLVLVLRELRHFSHHNFIIIDLLIFHLLININYLINDLGDLDLLSSLGIIPLFLSFCVFLLLLGPCVHGSLEDGHSLLVLFVPHLNKEFELLLLVIS